MCVLALICVVVLSVCFVAFCSMALLSCCPRYRLVSLCIVLLGIQHSSAVDWDFTNMSLTVTRAYPCLETKLRFVYDNVSRVVHE